MTSLLKRSFRVLSVERGGNFSHTFPSLLCVHACVFYSSCCRREADESAPGSMVRLAPFLFPESLLPVLSATVQYPALRCLDDIQPVLFFRLARLLLKSVRSNYEYPFRTTRTPFVVSFLHYEYLVRATSTCIPLLGGRVERLNTQSGRCHPTFLVNAEQ